MAYVFLSEGQQRSTFEGRTTTAPHVGPGYYNTNVRSRQKRASSAPFSINQERVLMTVPDPTTHTPGPGAYLDVALRNNDFEPRPSSSFASHTTRFDDDGRKIPGPGSYTPEPAKSHTHPPAPPPPPAKKNVIADIVAKHHTPPSVPTSNYGYDVDGDGNLIPHHPHSHVEEPRIKPKLVKKGPDFKRAPQRKSVFEEVQVNAVVPGPGDYNLAGKLKTGAVAFSSSKAPRFDPLPIQTLAPGPADYDPSLQIGKKPVVQKYQHPTLKYYEPDPLPPKPTVIRGSTLKKKPPSTTSMPSRPQTSTVSPGPGDYNLEPSRRERKGHGVSFRQSPRFKEEKKKQVVSPGPGYYEAPTEKHNGLAPISKTDDRFPRVRMSVPGVGAYVIDKEPTVPKKESSMFSSKTGRLSTKVEEGPAPQIYNVHKDPEAQKSVKFNQSERFNYEIELTPGPGDYATEVRHNRSPPRRAVSPFGTSGRFQKEFVLPSPGPADYNTQAEFEKKSYNKYLK